LKQHRNKKFRFSGTLPLMRTALTAILIFASLGLIAGPSANAAELSSEECAALLQRSTVTVRIRLQPAVAEKASPEKLAQEKVATQNAIELSDKELDTTQLTVCSGVAISEKLVVTAAFAAADSQIRLTLSGGAEAEAKLRVLDEFSGLALLEVAEATLAPLSYAEELPFAGSWVMSAAAWGTEQPVVSSGMIGGVGRTLKGAVYPPLLQCDVRPVETSCGAGIINRQGKLLGIFVATDGPETQRGWAYAVPVSHVQRLLRAQGENPRADAIIVLKRRRPTVGLVLEATEQGVFISRVLPASPAEKAGLKTGDKIVAAEGTKIRSVYEAVRPTLYKQPGDLMRFSIERDSKPLTLELVLGGGVELPGASLQVLGQLVQPKIDLGVSRTNNALNRTTNNEIKVRDSFNTQQMNLEPRDAYNDKSRLLEKTVEHYRGVIDKQLSELSQREQSQRQIAEELEALRVENAALKKKLEEKK
jgi:S1-C subfamily serine protease